MKKDRLLAILLLLLNKGKITSKELSNHFEVSERTIYRDIEAINLAGIPIVSKQGKNGGFEILEGFKIEKSFFTSNQLNTIITALKGLNTVLKDWQIDEVINKLSLLNKSSNSPSKRKNPIFINLLPYSNKSLLTNISRLKNAIEENKTVEFYYTDSKNESTERKVEPYNLILYGNSWYLYAYCYKRNDYRNFKVRRIKELKTLNETFIPRKCMNEIEWEEMWKKDWGIEKPTEITLEISKKAKSKAEEFFGTENLKENEKEGYTASITYPIDDWVYDFILSFGENIEVISPESLRNIIKEKALKIYEKY